MNYSLKNSSILCENAKSPSFALQSPRSQSLDRKLQRRPCKLSGRYQTDVTTQYPSVKRATKNRPSTSAVADLQSPKKCCLCLQKNCVCLNFSQSEKSYSTMSRCSKNHHKSGERKSSARDYVDNSGHKVTSDFGRADAINPSSILKTCQKNFDNQHITSDSATDCTKDKFLTFCRCENCPKRSFKVKKPCQNACSKVYLSCEKLADEKCEQCRCSNVQIQKSSTCACHVIKIHSPTCCTTENGRCSCKKQCVAKNRENQYCQTNEVVIETKEVVTNSGSVKSTKASRSVYPCEEKVGETTNLAKERFSSTSKLCCEKRQQCHTKMEFNERNTLRNKNSAVNASSIHKSPSRRCCCCCCCCKKKEKKEDDHPRHYFLKIEETEVGENNESVERRRSLEVK